MQVTTCNDGLNTFEAVLNLYDACPHVPAGSTALAPRPIAASTDHDAKFPHCAFLKVDVHPSQIGSYWLMVEGKQGSVGGRTVLYVTVFYFILLFI